MPKRERLHVLLVERSSDALRAAMAAEGDTKTVAVNNALQLYAWLLNRQAGGADVLIRDADGTTERLRLP